MGRVLYTHIHIQHTHIHTILHTHRHTCTPYLHTHSHIYPSPRTYYTYTLNRDNTHHIYHISLTYTHIYTTLHTQLVHTPHMHTHMHTYSSHSHTPHLALRRGSCPASGLHSLGARPWQLSPVWEPPLHRRSPCKKIFSVLWGLSP